ncbi:MAG: ribonuclease HII [Flavobacteriales bacterium]|nr:ribonuclease HII [Flavobacteriales bacterium]
MSLKIFFEKGKIEVGCDEAGRGCYAGPVYAAAVILDPKKRNATLNDSRKISKKTRDEQRIWIEKNAIDWAVGIVSAKEIDEINILNASFLAMHRAIEQLTANFDHLLIDGNRFNAYANKQHHCIIKGDSKFKNIAAASILAKTHRDEYMQKIAIDFPQYDWQNNQGYGTLKHRKALVEHGICEHHRKSYRLFSESTK